MVVKSRHIILQGDEAAASLWLPFAFNKLEEMRRERKKVNTNLRRLFNKVRKFEPATGITIMVKLYNDQGQIIINAESTGEGTFLTWPTSEICNNGWGDPFVDGDGEPINNGHGTCDSALYPRAIFTVNASNGKAVFERPPAFQSDYDTKDVEAGNVDWVSLDGKDRLTWWGYNSRHVVGGTWNTPAYSTNDYTTVGGKLVSGLIQNETHALKTRTGTNTQLTFRNKVYKDGVEYFTAPDVVLGACFRTDADGVKWVQVITGSIHNEYGITKLFFTKAPVTDLTDVTTTEVLDMKYLEYWQDILSSSSGANDHTKGTDGWFFNGSGTEAQVAQMYVYDDIGMTATSYTIKLSVDADGVATSELVEPALEGNGHENYEHRVTTQTMTGYSKETVEDRSFDTGYTTLAIDYSGDDLMEVRQVMSGTYDRTSNETAAEFVGLTSSDSTKEYDCSLAIQFLKNGVVVHTITRPYNSGSSSHTKTCTTAYVSESEDTLLSSLPVYHVDPRYYSVLWGEEVYISSSTKVAVNTAGTSTSSDGYSYYEYLGIAGVQEEVFSDIGVQVIGGGSYTQSYSDCGGFPFISGDNPSIVDVKINPAFTYQSPNQIQFRLVGTAVIGLFALLTGYMNLRRWQTAWYTLSTIPVWSTHLTVSNTLKVFALNMKQKIITSMDNVAQLPGTGPRYGPTGVL